MSRVVNVKVKYLRNPQNNEKRYENLEEWVKEPDHTYIGRNLSFYVKGAIGSKWRNPFSIQSYGRNGCLKKYEEYLRSHGTLYNELDNLNGHVLGCWCHPEPCHGHIIIKLLKEKKENAKTS